MESRDLANVIDPMYGGAPRKSPPALAGAAEGKEFIKTLGTRIATSAKMKLDQKEMSKAAVILQETLVKSLAKKGLTVAKSSAKFKEMAMKEAASNPKPYAEYGAEIVAIENRIKEEAKKKKSQETRELKKTFMKTITVTVKLSQ